VSESVCVCVCVCACVRACERARASERAFVSVCLLVIYNSQKIFRMSFSYNVN